MSLKQKSFFFLFIIPLSLLSFHFSMTAWSSELQLVSEEAPRAERSSAIKGRSKTFSPLQTACGS